MQSFQISPIITPDVSRLGAGYYKPLPISTAQMTDRDCAIYIGGIPVSFLEYVPLPIIFFLILFVALGFTGQIIPGRSVWERF